MPLIVSTNIPSQWNLTDLFIVRFILSSLANVHYTLDGTIPTLSSPKAIDNQVLVQGQGVINIKYFATNGIDTTAIVSTFILLDNVAPKTTLTVDHLPEGLNNWYKVSPTITLTATDSNSGLQSISYRWDDGIVQKYISPFQMPKSGGLFIEGTHKLEYYATDFAGNIEIIKLAYFKLDNEAPITVDDAPIGIQEEPTTIDFFYSDNASGIATTFFTTDGTLPTTDSTSGGSVTLDKSGTFDVKYFSMDQAGNQEIPKQTIVELNIDDVPPSTNNIYISENIPIDGKFGWYKTAPLISLTATDPSGISKIVYKFTPTNGKKQAKFTGSVNLLPTIDWDLFDGLGNLIIYGLKIGVDGNDPIEITFSNLRTITQVVSRINEVLGQTIASETDSTGAVGVGYLTLISPTTGTDNLTSEIKIIQPTNVDSTKILLGLEPALYPYSFKETDIFIQYLSSIGLPTDGEWIIEFYAVDRKGNESDHITKKYRLDRQSPITRLKLGVPSPDGNNGWYISDPKITFDVFDIASGNYKTYYQWNNGSLREFNGTQIDVIEGINTLNFFSIDNAGNIEELQQCTFKIDLIAPVTTDNGLELQGVIQVSLVPGWNLVENEIATVLNTTSIQVSRTNVKDAIIEEIVGTTIILHTVNPGIYATGPYRNILTFSPALLSTSALVRVTYRWDDSHLPETFIHDDPINRIGYSLTEPIYIPLSHDASVTYRLYPTDEQSGIAATYLDLYSAIETGSGFIKENKILSAKTTQLELDTDGLYLIEYFSVDNAGNIENKHLSSPIEIDKNYPQISAIFEAPNGNNGWYKAPFDLDVYVTTTDLITQIGIKPNAFIDKFKVITGINDQFYFEDELGIKHVVTITSSGASSFTGTALAIIIKNILNTVTLSSNYIVSYSAHRFTIKNSAGSFKLLWNSGVGGINANSIASLIGFDKTKDYIGTFTYTSDFYRLRLSQGYTGSASISNTGFFVQQVMAAIYSGSPTVALSYEQFAQPGTYGLYDEINVGGPIIGTDIQHLNNLRIDYKHYVTIARLDYGIDSSVVTNSVNLIPGLPGWFDNLIFEDGIPRGARYKLHFDKTDPSLFYLSNGDGYHELIFKAVDNNSLTDTDVLQKTTINVSYFFKYDSVPPVVSDDITLFSGYHPAPFIINVFHHDDLSGVDSVFYTTDGSAPSVSSEKAAFIDESHSHIVITQSGNYTISYIGEDKAGNLSTIKISPYSIKIDAEPPLTLLSVDPAVPDGNLVDDYQYTNQGWFITKPTVTLTSSDTLSGLKEIFYKFGGDYIINEAQPQLTFTTYSIPFEIGLEGNIDVEFYAIDNAGNQEPINKVVLHIDRTAPETVYDLSLSDATLTVSFDANDEVSGRDKTFFVIGDPIPITSSFTEDDSFQIPESVLPLTFHYYSIDKAGNTELTKTSTIQPLVAPRLREINPIPNAYDVSTEASIVSFLDDEDYGIDLDSIKITIQKFIFQVNTNEVLSVRYTGLRQNARLTIQNNRLITKLSGRLDLSIDLTSTQFNTIWKLNDYLNSLGHYSSTIIKKEFQYNASLNLENVYNQKINNALILKHYVAQNNPNFSFIERELGYLIFVTPDFIFENRNLVTVSIDCQNMIGKKMETYTYTFNPSILAKQSIEKRNYLQKTSLQFIEDIQNNIASNYTRARSSNFYGHHKAIALELARIIEELEHLKEDEGYDTVRAQYLYEKFGYLLTVEPLITTAQSSEQYRSLLLSLLKIFLKGSLKSSIENGIKLYSPFEVKLTELVFETNDISQQFIVTVDYLINQTRLIGVDFGLIIQNISEFFRIIKPAHDFIKQRALFEEPIGQIKIEDNFHHITVDGRADGFTLEMPELPSEELFALIMTTTYDEENAGDKIGINKKAFVLDDLNCALDDPNYLIGIQSFEQLNNIEFTYDLSSIYNIKVDIDSVGATEIDLRGATPSATKISEIIDLINNVFTSSTSQQGFIDNFYIESNVNNYIDFNEGSGELTAIITPGTYTSADLITEIQTQLNMIGTLTYTVSYNSNFTVANNHRFTISAGSNFSLLWNSGTNNSKTIGAIIGFDTSVDNTGANNYVATNYTRINSMLGAISIEATTSIQFTAPSGNDATDLVFGLNTSYPHTFYDIFSNRNI